MQILFWGSLAFILYVFIGYPIIISLLALGRPARSVRDLADEELPEVSLIIAAYNEEAHIERKLQNALNLDYPPEKLTVIVGSDGSNDATNEIVEKFDSERIRFSPFSVRRGKMAVVNDGVAQAQTEICVFTDVSELFDRNAIRKLVRNFQDPSVGAVTGNHIYNPSTSELAKGVRLYWLYQRWLQKMESRMATIMSCDGTIYACRRNLFEAPPVGVINDDKAVPWKMLEKGKRIVFEEEAVARGDALADTRSFFWQKVRGQAGMYQLFSMFQSFFLPRDPMRWFVFMSHAVGPIFAPWFVVIFLFSNIMLLDKPLYNFFSIVQCVFYLGATSGVFAQRYKKNIPILHIPYIFTVSNLASICGFLAFLFKTQKATWTKVE